MQFFLTSLFLLVAVTMAISPPSFQFALMFNCTPNGTVNHAEAHSQVLSTMIHNGSPKFHVHTDSSSDEKAFWTSSLVNSSATHWSEIGTVAFGASPNTAAGTLTFASPGMSGVVFSPDYGAIQYNITGGTGIFAGASGMMVDTFISSGNTSWFYINAWGFVWLPK